MTNFLAKLNPLSPLRLGLGLMYLYSGYDLFFNPRHWYGFVPRWLAQWVSAVSSVDTYLRAQGMAEFIIGLALLAWFLKNKWGRLAAILATVEMALILFFVGIDPITFRDIGLLGGLLALWIMLIEKDAVPN